MAIYACSDIHGHYDLYKKMLEGIGFSDEDELYIIGDMIDRGPEGIKIMQDVIKRKNVTAIIGNHELMMIDFLTHSGETGSYWNNKQNGGYTTRKQYEALTKEEQKEIMDFLNNLYLQKEITVCDTTFLLSHSFYIGGDKKDTQWKEADYQAVVSVVWDSPWRFWEFVPIQWYRTDKRIHIIGHTPVQGIEGEKEASKHGRNIYDAYVDTENCIINIDCGCAKIGRLNEREEDTAKPSLCCINLDEYAKGHKEKAFLYFRKNFKTDC